MKLSLKTFLQTGRLGDLRSGMTREEIVDILGQPDAWGGTSRKYREPSIYLYGTVEIYLEQRPPYVLTGFFWDGGDKGPFRMSDVCEIEDWDFTPEWTFEQVEDYLNDLEIDRTYHWPSDPEDSDNPRLSLPNGVRINFYKAQLHSVYGSL